LDAALIGFVRLKVKGKRLFEVGSRNAEVGKRDTCFLKWEVGMRNWMEDRKFIADSS
jgi:hypothetical protein